MFVRKITEALNLFVIDMLINGCINALLQGAEAQGPTLETGPTGCKEIIFF